MKRKKDFTTDFKWGAATSSFQIEGSIDADGKLESIWDRFSQHPDKIRGSDHAKVACDHYNRWEADFDLLEELGVNSYRFSVSWPRVIKGNLKDINYKGLDFYDKMVDGLLSRGIEPFLTLNHWDIPQAFHERGGWLKRDASQFFLDYTEIVSNKLGDRVKNWITHNEPWVIAHLGYNEGKHAPGHKSLYETLKVSHHLLLSHGKSVPIIKANSDDSKVGITLNLTPAYPASSSEADKRSAELFDQFFNTWYLNPLYGKAYPKEIIESWKDEGELIRDLDFIKDGDLDIIAVPTDFLGVNYYSRAINRCSNTDEDNNLPVEIIKEHDVWRLIVDIEGNSGWILGNLLKGDRYGIIISNSNEESKLFNFPKGNLIGIIGKNNIIKIKKCLTKWCLIQYQKIEGWIKKENIWGVYKTEIYNINFTQPLIEIYWEIMSFIQKR